MVIWSPDVLGDEFEQTTLELGEDDEGPVVATLVRALPAREPWQELWRRVTGQPRRLDDVDVLYVHGWSDYFFHKRLARTFTAHGARFYALDLRKYGRSLREGQTPGFITDLTTYDEDIAAALNVIGVSLTGPTRKSAAHGRKLMLLGHSTGGLVLSLWAARHPDAADALILNSPWLEFQLPRFTREAALRLVNLRARYRPLEKIPQIDLGYYSRAQHEAVDPDDPLETNLEWRPEQSMPVHVGWLHAVLEGHSTVAEGLHIDVPTFVMLSARTVLPTQWSEELTRADSVLIVDDIARAALRLGPVVTIARIDGALHDVFISHPDARNEAYRRLETWLAGWRGTQRE
ncbi:alpha/beta hydrolase [Microbacterium sp. YY-01]|uniref:alpha/beta hydrolase n=1 Tax=Microbacterium sp. YY-01 TaxID=3421634 RepID=UPI003D16343B